MALQAGIVGLPNVGKSTLFNAITKKNILAANYPFATIEPNVGVVFIPDKRIDFLKELYNPLRVIPTTFEFTDIAGLVKGAASGEGLGNKFLAHIREVDAIIEVVRCFDNENITHVTGKVNPKEDMDIINVELILADLEVITNRINKIVKKAETTKDKDIILELDVLKRCEESLMQNIPLRNLNLTNDEKKLIKHFSFLTIKPIIYVANVEENDIINENKYVKEVRDFAKDENAKVIVMSAKLEADLVDVEDNEKKEFLTSYGIKESGLDKLILATYNLLDLATFFTVGSDEVRAWTFKKGMKAPECAGLIHNDFERGFIRAEVMSYTDLESLKDEKKVQEVGKLRIEGKNYQIKDGDICYFRFNV